MFFQAHQSRLYDLDLTEVHAFLGPQAGFGRTQN